MSREARIKDTLTEHFHPTILDVINDSDSHAGHAGVKEFQAHIGELPRVQKQIDQLTHISETHFIVRIQSDKLQGKSRIQQHTCIYTALDAEFKTGLHSLQIIVYPS